MFIECARLYTINVSYVCIYVKYIYKMLQQFFVRMCIYTYMNKYIYMIYLRLYSLDIKHTTTTLDTSCLYSFGFVLARPPSSSLYQMLHPARAQKLGAVSLCLWARRGPVFLGYYTKQFLRCGSSLKFWQLLANRPKQHYLYIYNIYVYIH